MPLHSLAADELLDAWERALPQVGLERALTLLATATGQSWAELAALPLGVRNAHLLEMHVLSMGDELQAVTDCPHCGERLEMDFRISDLLAVQRLEQATEPRAQKTLQRELRVNGSLLEYRLLTTDDLIGVGAENDPEAARRALLERVVTWVSTEHGDADPVVLSEPVIQTLAAEIEQDDPLAAIRMRSTCPNCRHNWDTVLEIASFFWNEVDAWAKHTLREVHTLATAYGWSEQEILAPARNDVSILI